MNLSILWFNCRRTALDSHLLDGFDASVCSSLSWLYVPSSDTSYGKASIRKGAKPYHKALGPEVCTEDAISLIRFPLIRPACQRYKREIKGKKRGLNISHDSRPAHQPQGKGWKSYGSFKIY